MHFRATNKEPALWHKLICQLECQRPMVIPAQMPAPTENPGCCTCSLVPVLGHLQSQQKMAQVPLTLETWLECRLLPLAHSCSRHWGKISFWLSLPLQLSNKWNKTPKQNTHRTLFYWCDQNGKDWHHEMLLVCRVQTRTAASTHVCCCCCWGLFNDLNFKIFFCSFLYS